MITKILTVTACLLWPESTNLLSWHGTYSEAVEQAKREDKPLFILFDGGPSAVVRVVNNAPDLNDSVERALSDGYVVLFVDVNTEAGRKVATAYNVVDLPFTVVLDRSVSWQMFRRAGNPPVSELIATLGQHRRANHVSAKQEVSRVESPRDDVGTSARRAENPTAIRLPVRIESPVYSRGELPAWCRT